MKKFVEVYDDDGELIERREISINDWSRSPIDQDFIEQAKDDLLADGYSPGSIADATYKVIPS